MRIGSILTFVAGFGLARAALLFAPIVLANIIPLADYGQLELAHSYAAIAAVLVGFGLPSSAPLVLLRKEVSARWDTLLLSCIAISTGAIVVAMTGFVTTGALFSLPTLVPLLVAVLVLQQLWATTLKSKGAGTRSVCVEAGLWVAALCGALLASGSGIVKESLSIALLFYFCCLLALAVRQYLGCRAAFGPLDLLDNFRTGAPLMATVALSMLTASSGRLILGSVTDVATVGVYAILYRSTMLPLIGHQILMIALFRRLFTWEQEELKRRVAIVPACVTLGVLIFWMLSEQFGFLLGQSFVESYATYRVEAVVILGQTILWSAVAQNDLLIIRNQIAGHVARRMFFVLLVCLPGLAIVTHSVASSGMLRTFVLGYSVVIFLYYLIQCTVIARQGHRFILLWGTATAGFLATTGLMLSIEWS